ncbi:MAG: methylenetetrahydrofolate--tRNA-(uracil(54)-C(5))-methyltransferase (FADH(2)-oxidizing) TrmFO [Myxococcales bacterium]|nr:methylenetetrahydrofolate--tRNA-(uracil(54)-C(5))-methyltransferase (FADH(2)-oxidizing) TrmFO [Myxococcales bacterium]MCB9628118.1 methylenetetrahydrofolate--tRNA-(uracil(54)-C(5))-methyltransferase (FADH(2)-oxidizing) TrmFO [Sandaracinaceae bacterium]
MTAPARTPVTVVGAGLAGTECAFQLAERGVPVRLLEQKPLKRTPAQHMDSLAELVCSNSFRGNDLGNAVGLLKEELRRAGSLVMRVGTETQVPAGGAFAVDRELFSAEMTRRIDAHPMIERVATEVETIPEARPVVLATGPLTGDALAADLAGAIGEAHLAYYDAIAPVVTADSVNWDIAFRQSRYDKGGDDAYGNCPFTAEEYEAFVAALLAAEKVEPKTFEKIRYFEGCLPIEVMAERGYRTLSFGCMKPVGLTDPRTGKRPHAVVQLRAENDPPTAYNLVGFQTRMKWPDQKRVFRMIPGLENAEFERLGSVHRNTFVNAPKVLDDSLALLARPGVYLAGQVSGVEGYIESAALGFLLGVQLARQLEGLPEVPVPPTTALGALRGHLRRESPNFQPSNVVWSMFPELEGKPLRDKKLKKERMGQRALADLGTWLGAVGIAWTPPQEPAAAPTDATPDEGAGT